MLERKTVYKCSKYKCREDDLEKDVTFYYFHAGYYIVFTSSLEYENQSSSFPLQSHQKLSHQQSAPARQKDTGRCDFKYLALTR